MSQLDVGKCHSGCAHLNGWLDFYRQSVGDGLVISYGADKTSDGINAG